VQAAQPAKGLQQALAHLDGVLAPHAHPQQDGQQFGAGKSLRAEACQALARAFGRMQIGNSINGLAIVVHGVSPLVGFLKLYNKSRR
jgi:hypothetical protein